jgi:hypothetical protein
MAKIIPLKEKLETVPGNLITLKPWEFRRADWDTKHFIQMLRSQSTGLDKHRNELYKRGDKRIWHLPGHFALKGGMAHTIHSLYNYRKNEEKMREVYYLAGLIDCMINQVNPLLRTDLIRDLYKKIVTLKKILGANWYGHIDQVLFPIDIQLFNHHEYRETISRARTMKEFYGLIRKGTEEMFDILSLEYIFYTPGRGA